MHRRREVWVEQFSFIGGPNMRRLKADKDAALGASFTEEAGLAADDDVANPKSTDRKKERSE